MQIALFEPDIPQNVGTIIRLCACMDVSLHIIEPCGFPFSIKALRRSAMDYIDHATLIQHNSWDHFHKKMKEKNARIVLLTTKTKKSFLEFEFDKNDILLLGRESAGVPDLVFNACDEQITIPMNKNLRSLNVAVSTALVLGEGLRQTNEFPTIA